MKTAAADQYVEYDISTVPTIASPGRIVVSGLSGRIGRLLSVPRSTRRRGGFAEVSPARMVSLTTGVNPGLVNRRT
jgi:hypothetical protein